ncbi:MAG TPA: pilus assembly protein TadG-related protein, partial [Nocardioides sp.]|nr:pilus assembly protein TadG-related protein [Nocardioides sp.]
MRRRDERGAVLPFVAVSLTLVIAMAAFAVDLGMQRVVRRDMQALADVVALDLSRLVNGRTAAQIEAGYNGFPTISTELARSVARNGDTLGDAPVVAYKLVRLDAATGQLETSGGTVRALAGAEVPNAVWVEARGSVDFAFATGSGGATRTAVAQPSPSACFRLGSYAAGVDTEDATLLNALLTSLLGTSVNLSLASYQALAGAELGVLDLVAVDSLNVGTFEELMALDGLTVAQLVTATAAALQNDGGDAVAVSALESIALHAIGPTTVGFADLLSIATGDTAALAAELNVLDLVTAAAFAANGGHVLTAPSIGLLLPSLGTVTTSTLTIGNAPTTACGSEGVATARTGQASVALGGTLADLPVDVGVFDLTARTTVSANLMLATADGLLTDIVCGDATAVTNAEGIDVQVSSAVASEVSLTASVRVTATLDVGLARVKVDVTTPVTASSGPSAVPATTVPFRHPPDAYGTAKGFGSGVVLSSLTTPTADPDAAVEV